MNKTNSATLARVPATIYVVAAAFFALLAAAFVAISFALRENMFFLLALALLSSVKVALNLFAFKRTRSGVRSTAFLLSGEWKILAVTSFCVAVLFFASAVGREGFLGWIGGPVYVFLAVVFWFAANRASMAVV